MSSRRRAPDDDLMDDEGPEGQGSARNPYASATRWRHQESSAFARHAGNNSVAREPEARGRVNELASFLNTSRISPEEQHDAPPGTPRFKPILAGAAEAREATNGSRPVTAASRAGPPPDGKEIAVGPLLNYRRMEGNTWIGSVLVVTKGGGKTQPFAPTLVLNRAGQQEGTLNGANGESSGAEGVEIGAVCLYSDPRDTFWRFDLAVPMSDVETKWEYTLPGLRFASATKPRRSVFHVPSVHESFRIMFHSCNGFSVGTDEEAWSGAALWNDVLRRHSDVPFHVM